MSRRPCKPENSLQAKYPMLAKEWDNEKNEMAADEISYGNAYKAHWICSVCHHQWEATVNSRTRGNGCPECKRRNAMVRVHIDALQRNGSLLEHCPGLAEEWHPKKNGTLTPADVTPGSHDIVWWQCSHNHEWQAEIKARVRGNGCPYCAAANHASFPELALAHYLSMHFKVVHAYRPEWLNHSEIDIFLSERQTGIEYDGVYFHMGKDEQDKAKTKLCKEHNLQMIRVREHGLSIFEDCLETPPVDVNYRYMNETIVQVLERLQVPSADVDVERDYEIILTEWKQELAKNSIAAVPLLSEQYDKEKNKAPAEKVKCNSNRKVYWIDAFGHSWQDTPAHRFGRGSGCPYCAGKRVLEGFNDLSTKKPELAKEWYLEKNDKLPSMVVTGTSKKYWWQCKQGHCWEASVSSRVRGNGCPYCAGQRPVEGITDLQTLEPELCKQWNIEKNGELLPSMVTRKSNRKVWWKCENGHEWQAVVSGRTGVNGTGCPLCRRKRIQKK